MSTHRQQSTLRQTFHILTWKINELLCKKAELAQCLHSEDISVVLSQKRTTLNIPMPKLCNPAVPPMKILLFMSVAIRPNME